MCALGELIVISSLLTFDVYKTYVKPKATPSQLIFVSYVMTCIFGLTVVVFLDLERYWYWLGLAFPSHRSSHRWCCVSCCFRYHLERSDESKCHLRLSKWSSRWVNCLVYYGQTVLWQAHRGDHKAGISDAIGESRRHHERSHYQRRCLAS